ncbi:helix-turn-helix domain-containing protein [Klenkia sp. LSe6-5]|uniref:Helix-turn-helix domain-containing protein n=1 Tax=Klenkia sesuvii TaxID=3103137 RepID=A0ABU8DWU2_9ACTN
MSTEWAYAATPSDVGAFLRRARERQGLSQQELADDLGINRRYVYELEAGRPNIFADRLFQTFRHLGVRVRLEERDDGL